MKTLYPERRSVIKKKDVFSQKEKFYFKTLLSFLSLFFFFFFFFPPFTDNPYNLHKVFSVLYSPESEIIKNILHINYARNDVVTVVHEIKLYYYGN